MKYTKQVHMAGASSADAIMVDDSDDTIIEASGSDRRTGDLFGDRNFLKRASKMAKTIRGVENVYTQHQPLLTQTIEELTKSRLKEADYPFSNRPASLPAMEPTVRPKRARARPRDRATVASGLTLPPPSSDPSRRPARARRR